MNNPPYRDVRPTANQSGEVIKMQHEDKFGYKNLYQEYILVSTRVRYAMHSLYASSGRRAIWVPTNNQRGRRSEPCYLWGGLDKARHIVTTALLVRVHCFRNGLYKVVEGPSTKPSVLSIITGSYCRRQSRFTIFEPDEMKIVMPLILLSL